MSYKRELNEILENHKKWLIGDDGERADLYGANLQEADLQGADLRLANLQGADLRLANLQGADLQGTDLQGTDLDYSCWPLCCGSLDAHVDDRIVIQLLYHTLSVVKHSPYVSKDIKDALLTDSNLDIANRFHRVDECGKLTMEVEE